MNRMPACGRSLSTHVLAAMLCAACTPEPPQEPEPEIAPWRAAPVTTWIEFAGNDIEELPAYFEQLVPAEGWSAETTSGWIVGYLASLPKSESLRVALGLAPPARVLEAGFTPFLATADGSMALSHTCISANECTGCDNALTTSGEAPATPEGAFRGICSTLSTAYSLSFVLGVRPPFDPDIGTVEERQEREDGELVTKRYWKKGFLTTIREDQGHIPDGGTPRDKIKKAYERYGCSCDEEVSLASVGNTNVWKNRLKAKVEAEPPADCQLIFSKRGSVSHDVNVAGFNEDGDIEVAETGAQGSGSGEDAPVLVENQVWTVEGNSANPTIRCTATRTGNTDFWNGLNFDEAAFLCCTCPR